MSNFPLLVVFATVMGLSIFLSLPVVLRKAMASRTILFLNAAAIGILIFLMGDIFSDAAPIIYPNPSNPYVADFHAMALFLIGLLLAFLVLFWLERPSASAGATSPARLGLIVALAIGFQNLTEGLVFGAYWAAGISGALAVIFVGFFLQNVTEGFPIAAPFLGTDRPRLNLLVLYFLIGGLPTVIGGVLGYFWNSNTFDLFVDALAIGAILYCVLPMLRMCFRPAATREETRGRQDLVYLGVIVGFALGFAVNAI